MMTLLLTQAAAEDLSACAQRVSLALWENTVLVMGTILSKANDAFVVPSDCAEEMNLTGIHL